MRRRRIEPPAEGSQADVGVPRGTRQVFDGSVQDGAQVPMALRRRAACRQVEAAANLFAMVRALDDAGPASIAVMPIPDEGLGLAINDRLRRAAAPRETPS